MNKGNGIHVAELSRGRFTSIGVAGISEPGTGIDGRGATPLPVPRFAGTGWAAVLCAAYPTLAAAPMIAMHVLRPEADHPVASELGINCALVGFTLLSMQFILTARLSWIEAPFGLDLVLRFHRAMALVIVALLCAHPLLLASAEGWTLLTRFKAHWPLWAGRIALGLLLVQVTVALLRGSTRMPYERWRRAHNAIALSILGLGFAHAVRMGHDLHGAALADCGEHSRGWGKIRLRHHIRPVPLVEPKDELPRHCRPAFDDIGAVGGRQAAQLRQAAAELFRQNYRGSHSRKRDVGQCELFSAQVTPSIGQPPRYLGKNCANPRHSLFRRIDLQAQPPDQRLTEPREKQRRHESFEPGGASGGESSSEVQPEWEQAG